jgi:hypothetical protein
MNLICSLLHKVLKEISWRWKFAEDVSTKKLAILKKEFDAGNISKTAYESVKHIKSSQVDITISNAQSELDIYKKVLNKR